MGAATRLITAALACALALPAAGLAAPRSSGGGAVAGRARAQAVRPAAAAGARARVRGLQGADDPATLGAAAAAVSAAAIASVQALRRPPGPPPLLDATGGELVGADGLRIAGPAGTPAGGDGSAQLLTPRAPLAFSFSVGGLLFPYQLGVGVSLTDSGHIVPGVTPLSGSSAGSLVATVLALGLDLELVMARLEAILADCRAGGTAGRLGSILERELVSALPADCAERLSNGCLTVAYMRMLPLPRAVRCAAFKDRDDLFEVLRASCNWPFFLARAPLVRCRGNLSLDGYFVAPRTLGCLVPMHNAHRTVAVSAFPAFAVPTMRELVPAHDLIHPNMDGRFPGPPEGLPEWLQSALQAYSPARAHELFEMGRRHGSLWAERHGGVVPASNAPAATAQLLT